MKNHGKKLVVHNAIAAVTDLETAFDKEKTQNRAPIRKFNQVNDFYSNKRLEFTKKKLIQSFQVRTILKDIAIQFLENSFNCISQLFKA